MEKIENKETKLNLNGITVYIFKSLMPNRIVISINGDKAEFEILKHCKSTIWIKRKGDF